MQLIPATRRLTFYCPRRHKGDCDVITGASSTSSPLSRQPTAVILLSFPAESQSTMAFVTEVTDDHIRASKAIKVYGG